MSGIFNRPASKTGNSSISGDISKDVQLLSPPEDSISWLSWSPAPTAQSNYLAVSSWDSKVRIYSVGDRNPQGKGEAIIDFGGPVLSCDWSKDGTKVVGAGADKTAKLLDLTQPGSPAQQIGAHDAPIRSVKFFNMQGSVEPMVVTGSWDKTIKYWDLRSSTPAASIDMGERVYAMDVKDKLLVIGLGGDNRYIKTINLASPTTIHSTKESPLKHQTRTISCFKDGDGFMIGSVEGRCAFQYLEEKDSSKNMSFRCHRDTAVRNVVNVWTVNAISTHPKYGTFSTAGSDGKFNFWDKEAKARLKGFSDVGHAISATAFSPNGDIFAYAVSYDWHKGFAVNKPDYPNKIMLHKVIDADIRPKGWKGP